MDRIRPELAAGDPAHGGGAAPAPVAAAVRWGAAALLGLLTLALFAGARTHAFLHYDDDLYVTDNPWVRAGLTWRGVAWAFTTFHAANWHPLTWLSHMLDVQLLGLDAGAHHLVAAALHATNAALLLLVLARLTGAPVRSAAAAALYALHPLRVEPVAWVAERKELLGALFGLLMLAAYAGYARRPSVRRYLAVLAAFAASLLSKPTWVTAPLLLLLLDLWPLQRVAHAAAPRDPGCPAAPPRRPATLLLEKLPLLALSAAISAVVVLAQRSGGAVVRLEHLGPADRVANALVSCARYLGKTAWPAPLSPLYPFPAGGWPILAVAGAAALVAAVTVTVLRNARRWPWAAAGWCWFLGALVPMIGLVQVGSQAMADRYTYLPGIGLAIGVVWSIAAAVERRGRAARAAAGAAAVAVAATLAWITAAQLALWRDQETLFRHAVAVTGPNPRAHLILSQAIAERGRYVEALPDAREAARLDPANPRARKHLGFVLYRAGLLDEAIAELEAAVALDPAWAEAHGNLGIAYGRRGRFEDAARELGLEQRLRAARPQR